MNRTTDWVAWSDPLIRRFKRGRTSGHDGREAASAACVERLRRVAKVRWLLLLVLALYGVFAGSTYLFSRYGFFITREQAVLLAGVIVCVICYNLIFTINPATLQCGKSARVQTILDLLAVTILIYCSGGATSWFWPVYMIVTLEAAYLLEREREVWLVGGAGGIFYCLLLSLEQAGVIPSVRMPFVDSALNHDRHYLFLMALWVMINNAATAVIANYLMTVMRREAKLSRENEERLFIFIDNANDLIHCNDLDGRVLFMNRAMRRALGYSSDELERHGFNGILTEEAGETCSRDLQKVLAGKKVDGLELSFRGSEGQELSVEGSFSCNYLDGAPTSLWGIWRDVTEKKRSQARLYTLAHNDNLTGLPNRILFRDRLQQAIAYANRQKRYVALLFMDLDRFKVINDSLGHPVGDRLLQMVARTLLSSVREVDTVARFGGDEFTIVLGNLEKREDAEMVAGKILDALQKPFNIDGHELFALGSVGISISPDHGDDIDGLIKKADVAMYAAKTHGGGRYLLYDPAMDEHSHKRLLLENSLRKALAKGEFRLVYQPKVDIVSGSITAMEALLRWEHPEFGLIKPDEFIPLAEETGLILAIGEWVLEHACRQNVEWQGMGIGAMRVAVNISGYQLQQSDFLERLDAVVSSTGMAFEHLELEITESVIMQNPEFAIQILNEVQSMGIHISVDDFGTGYSSLSHLKRFSVNTLKIDKSFVRDVETSSTDAAITSAIIAMGSSLNLRVIAEGVETEGQFSFLKDAMCDEVQGYLVSRPMAADKVVDFMKTRGWRGRRSSD